jgi:uncharacterized protein (DUF2141 family)
MIFKYVQLAVLFLALSPGLATAEQVSLAIRIVGAEPPTGRVEVSVFNSPENYFRKTYEQAHCRPDEDGTCEIVFNSLPAGDYALVIVHDANDNQKLDNGFLGFGAERFTYSNGARNPLFGRASFEDAKITLSAPEEIEIDLD